MRKHSISFRNAVAGILTAVRTQANVRIHLIAASIVFAVSVWLQISIVEALILLIAVVIVLVAEMANTALEFLSDAVTLEHNENIRNTKDIAAGAVLLAALFSLIIGVLIFLPKLIAIL